MTIRLAADLQPDSIVDGLGIRTVIWTQGCSHDCPGCQNPQTHDFKGGVEVPIEEVKQALSEVEGQTGITLSGGDPLFQVKPCIEICKYAKERGMDIWCYTGFLYEDLLKKKEQRELLSYIDVLVDGKFVISEFSMNLKFKGSRNQRIIDVPKSLEEGKVCLLEACQEEYKENTGPMYQEKECVFI